MPVFPIGRKLLCFFQGQISSLFLLDAVNLIFFSHPAFCFVLNSLLSICPILVVCHCPCVSCPKQLVIARYSNKGHDTIRYHTKYCDTIPSESASPYVRTASKQATAHNTGAPSFCLSTLSPVQVPGYWPSGEATVVAWLCATGEATIGGQPVFLEVQGYSARLL